jgi:hypothetical protein
MIFKYYFAKSKNLGRSMIGKAVLTFLLVTIPTLWTMEEVKAQEIRRGETKAVQKKRPIHEEVEIIKSDNMTPETSIEVFLDNFKKEMKNGNSHSRLFIKRVTRGLLIELRYNDTGIHILSKQNTNPNYHVEPDGEYSSGSIIVIFNQQLFCISPDLLKKFCKKEMKNCSYSYGSISFNYGMKQTQVVTFANYEKLDPMCIERMFLNR